MSEVEEVKNRWLPTPDMEPFPDLGTGKQRLWELARDDTLFKSSFDSQRLEAAVIPLWRLGRVPVALPSLCVKGGADAGRATEMSVCGKRWRGPTEPFQVRVG